MKVEEVDEKYIVPSEHLYDFQGFIDFKSVKLFRQMDFYKLVSIEPWNDFCDDHVEEIDQCWQKMLMY